MKGLVGFQFANLKGAQIQICNTIVIQVWVRVILGSGLFVCNIAFAIILATIAPSPTLFVYFENKVFS